MHYSHILITRPYAEAMELAALLAPFRVEVIILPAFEFAARALPPEQVRQLQQSVIAPQPPLLVFTSPRAVDFGLGQVPPGVLKNSRIAAVGASTAEVLLQSGISDVLSPRHGYSSEDLLETIRAEKQLHAPIAAGEAGQAFIFAAPGGRDALREGLEELGFLAQMLLVYERIPASLEPTAIAAIEQAESLLAVWTSANSMNALHQRLPAGCWASLRQAEWLVISDRLMGLAQSFKPAKLHLALGPANADILGAIQALA
ncbi:MAG TPA: uroporphyrinogen-III synthase [Xanthomonadales bacterium]|nr:uroporphyrinogen-III synthase [Xanthomonadales bacterium]